MIIYDCRIPLKTYALLAFLTVATMGLSNTSVGYLNYPTQVIFKCCKLIPVMVGSILIQGERCAIKHVISQKCHTERFFLYPHLLIGHICTVLKEKNEGSFFNISLKLISCCVYMHSKKNYRYIYQYDLFQMHLILI